METSNDFTALRERMVAEQLIPRDITDEKVLNAFRTTARHLFVAQEFQKSSYGDFPLPIDENQTISQPYIVALMTQSLVLQKTDTVLEIGTGSGYQSAILAQLTHHVYSIERKEKLARNAQQLFQTLYITNITVHIGDGTLGWPHYSPYNKIIITAAAPQLPTQLVEQLQEHGKIVLPIADTQGQVLAVFTKQQNHLTRENLCACRFVPLIGKNGY